MRREPTPAPALALGEALRAVVAVAGAAADERAALAAGLAWIVAALGADAGAVVRHGAVVTTTGWDGPPPAPAALGQGDGTAAIDSGRVVIARAGAPLGAAEVAWLQALVAALETTAALAGRLADERAARARAEEHASALVRARRLFEDLSTIQRSISHRAPLPQVLEAIAAAAEHLFGDENCAVLLADEHDPRALTLAIAPGLDPDYRETLSRRRAGEGAAGRAYDENRLVVVEDYDGSPDGIPTFRRLGITAAMAAPVHEHGRPIGRLIVSTKRPGRRYSAVEREILISLAEHASLAVSDARSVAATAHQATHDGSPGCPTARCSATASTTRSPARAAPATRSRCSSSTSTASRRSTTASATPAATSCSSPWPGAWTSACAAPTRPLDSAATSSPCSSRTSTTPATPSPWRSASSRRSPSR